MRVLVFSDLIDKQQRAHEDMLRELGFDDVETRAYPARVPAPGSFKSYDVVLAVTDHTSTVSCKRVEMTAKAENVHFFYVTKRPSTEQWQRVKEWCADNLENAPSPPAAPSVRVYSHELPPKEQRELNEWKEMSENLAVENDGLKARAESAESQLEALRKTCETLRDEAIKAKADVERFKKEAANARADRDEIAQRKRALEDTNKELRQQLIDAKTEASKVPAKNGHGIDKEVVRALGVLVEKNIVNPTQAWAQLMKTVEKTS